MKNEYALKENVVFEKSFQFALDIIFICKKLKSEKEFEIAKQLLRSGTSVGANIEEAQSALSRKDFIHKLSISYKEIRESIYWIKLLLQSDILKEETDKTLLLQAIELEKILSSIIISSKKTNH